MDRWSLVDWSRMVQTGLFEYGVVPRDESEPDEEGELDGGVCRGGRGDQGVPP